MLAGEIRASLGILIKKLFKTKIHKSNTHISKYLNHFILNHKKCICNCQASGVEPRLFSSSFIVRSFPKYILHDFQDLRSRIGFFEVE